jgi:cell division protein FtsI (penicillin-binding protein 3)
MKGHRILIIVGLLVGLAIFILFNYVQVMLWNDGSLSQATISFPTVERGNIYDRHGRLLAATVTLNTVTAWLPHVQNLEETVNNLAPLLSLNPNQLLERMSQSDGFLFIKRKVSPSEGQAVMQLIREGRLPGIQVQDEYGRVYPNGSLGAHWLGFVGTDNVGLAGVEFSYNNVLMPSEITAPQKIRGADIYLSMDSSLQYLIEQIALKTLNEWRAQRVFALVVHATTGEMLAMAQVPSFYPDRFNEFPAEIRKNHLAESVYEPGSVFKIFSLGVLLESRVINRNSTFVCNGFYTKQMPNGEIIQIKCNGIHGVVDPMGILQVSCNSGIAQASDLLDENTFDAGLRAFGFGSTTQSPFTGESTGLFAPPQRWSGRSKPTIAFGQEIGVSALQMVEAATVLGNQGRLLKLQFVKRIIDSQGEVLLESSPQELRRVLSPNINRELLEMLRASVNMGSGFRARVQGVEIGGKTGTAQILDPQTNRYSETDFLASIITVLPALSPEYIIYVGVVSPRGASIFGERVAAPAAREIAERLISLYGITRQGDQIIEHSGEVSIQKPNLPLFSDTLPDFRGYSKRTLLPLLNHPQLRVKFKGEGHVKRQSLPPGTRIREGMDLTLEFE